MPSGWPSAMAPPLTLTLSGSRPELVDADERLRAKASFSSTRSRSSAEPARSSALRGRARPDAHDRRVDAGDRRRHDPRDRLQPELARPVGLDEQDRGRAVVDAGALPAVTDAASAERRPELRQRLEPTCRRAGARRGR